MDSQYVGKRVRLLRQEKSVNQAELGKVLGVSASAVSDIERGVTKLNVEDLFKLAEYFEISLSAFLEPQKEAFRPPLTRSFGAIQMRGSRGMTEEQTRKIFESAEKFVNEFTGTVSPSSATSEWNDDKSKNK